MAAAMCNRLGPAVLVLAASLSAASAADWSANARISETLSFSDNLQLNEADREPAFGSTTRLGLTLRGRQGATNWSLGTGFRARAFTGRGADSDAVTLRPGNIRGRINYNARQYSLGGNFSFRRRSTTFITFDEIDDFDDADDELPDGADDPDDTDGADGADGADGVDGAVDTAIRQRQDTVQTLLNLGTNLGFAVDALNSVNAGIQTTIVRFSDDDPDLTPSTSIAGSFGWSGRLTPRTTTGFSVRLRRFMADDRQNTQSTGLSLRGRLGHRWTPRVSSSASLGLNLTRITRNSFVNNAGVLVPGSEETRVNGVGSLGVSMRRRATSLSINASQSVRPSTFGDLRTVTSVGVRVSHRINNWSRISFPVRYSLQSELGGDEDINQFFSVGPSYSVRLADNWRASLRYQFRLSADDDGTGLSNSVSVSVSRNLNIWR